MQAESKPYTPTRDEENIHNTMENQASRSSKLAKSLEEVIKKKTEAEWKPDTPTKDEDIIQKMENMALGSIKLTKSSTDENNKPNSQVKNIYIQSDGRPMHEHRALRSSRHARSPRRFCYRKTHFVRGFAIITIIFNIINNFIDNINNIFGEATNEVSFAIAKSPWRSSVARRAQSAMFMHKVWYYI